MTLSAFVAFGSLFSGAVCGSVVGKQTQTMEEKKQTTNKHSGKNTEI